MYSYILENENKDELEWEIKLIKFYRGLNEERKTKFLDLIETLSMLLLNTSENEKEC
ncbi:hypothetical protein MKD14_08885 [[Clostridium] innocuum]|nr:hypothetical protein [[Clostridium] innocuum]